MRCGWRRPELIFSTRTAPCLHPLALPTPSFRSLLAARGSFLAQSWGYLQMWHLLDATPARRLAADQPAPAADAAPARAAAGGRAAGGGRSGRWRGAARASDELDWQLCAEHVAGDRCVGFRCGLEFKMPMRTAAVGWFVALRDSPS